MLADANTWVCVKDNGSGLLWEGKTRDGGLRDARWEYAWYQAGNGQTGLAPVGTNYPCAGLASCDTTAYLSSINELGLCGQNNWRLPTPEELVTLARRSDTFPPVDKDYFGDTSQGPIPYCTSDMSRAVNFGLSFTDDTPLDASSALIVANDGRYAPCRIRLVSGGVK